MTVSRKWEDIGDAPESLVGWATQSLRQLIIGGELRPGEPLVIKNLSERLGISPTPLREALQWLTAYGLVSQKNRRTSVALLSRELDDIYELRVMLEPIAVERSIQAAGDEWVAAVDFAHDQMVAASTGGGMNFEIEHREFHRTLVAACPSPYLRRFVGNLLDSSSRYRMLAIRHADYTMTKHDALYEACRRLDAAAAKSLVREHIVQLTLSQVEILETLGFLEHPARSTGPNRLTQYN